MASRWMAQMRQRQRQYKARQGKASLTVQENKFYRRKVLINPSTGQVIKVESVEDHLDRMNREANSERNNPKEPHRVFSRLLKNLESLQSLENVPLDNFERQIVHNKIHTETRANGSRGATLLDQHVTIYDLEKSILRYRRLTGRTASQEKAKKEAYKQLQKRRKLFYFYMLLAAMKQQHQRQQRFSSTRPDVEE